MFSNVILFSHSLLNHHIISFIKDLIINVTTIEAPPRSQVTGGSSQGGCKYKSLILSDSASHLKGDERRLDCLFKS